MLTLKKIEDFLGYKRSFFKIKKLTGGANNQVFKINLKNQSFILKHYFQNTFDQRKRLQSEFAFLTFAWKEQIKCIPEPLKYDEKNNLALYGFIEANTFSVKNINTIALKQAVSFFLKLNQNKSLADHLPPASESCFSLSDYFLHVENRFEKFFKLKPQNPLQKKVRSLVCQNFLKKWNEVKTEALKKIETNSFDLHTTIKKENLCLTPSDFGFHNALIDQNQKIFFIDFEYAGWDDPVKTTLDFFCQPKYPVPEKYFSLFSKAIAFSIKNPDEYFKRLSIAKPLCQFKWSFILMNSFLKTGNTRRKFSKNKENLKEQLKKALTLVNHIETSASYFKKRII